MTESTLQNRLRHWRKARGLTQSRLGDEIGVTRQTIIAIEKGRLNPSVTIALALANALEVPVEALFYLELPTTDSAGDETQADEPVFQIPAGPVAEAGNEGAPLPEGEDDAETPGAVWDFV